jgi:hypothetical protein
VLGVVVATNTWLNLAESSSWNKAKLRRTQRHLQDLSSAIKLCLKSQDILKVYINYRTKQPVLRVFIEDSPVKSTAWMVPEYSSAVCCLNIRSNSPGQKLVLLYLYICKDGRSTDSAVVPRHKKPTSSKFILSSRLESQGCSNTPKTSSTVDARADDLKHKQICCAFEKD